VLGYAFDEAADTLAEALKSADGGGSAVPA
jgi:hypothetical protein